MCNTPFPHRSWSCLGPGTSEAENGVRDVSLWGALLGVEKTVIYQRGFDHTKRIKGLLVRLQTTSLSRGGEGREPHSTWIHR